MRLALTLAALLLIVPRINADDPAGAAKQPPTDATIIKLCGDSLANMFAKCGLPQNIYVNGDNLAILGYGPFGFAVNNKTVTRCYFFGDWTGAINVTKIGDTKDSVVKALGSGYCDVKGNGFEAYGWTLTEPKVTFWAYFTDNKVDQVQITPIPSK